VKQRAKTNWSTCAALFCALATPTAIAQQVTIATTDTTRLTLAQNQNLTITGTGFLNSTLNTGAGGNTVVIQPGGKLGPDPSDFSSYVLNLGPGSQMTNAGTIQNGDLPAYFVGGGSLINTGNIIGFGTGAAFANSGPNTFAASVDNSGTIKSVVSPNGTARDAVWGDTRANFTVVNQKTGLIEGFLSGVVIKTPLGLVRNEGTLLAHGPGRGALRADNGGTLINNGLTQGDSLGILAWGSVLNVTNNGTIAGLAGPAIQAGNGLTLRNTGTIDSPVQGNAVLVGRYPNSSYRADIQNSGVLKGNVVLSSSNNSFLMDGGSLEGALNMGNSALFGTFSPTLTTVMSSGDNNSATLKNLTDTNLALTTGLSGGNGALGNNVLTLDGSQLTFQPNWLNWNTLRLQNSATLSLNSDLKLDYVGAPSGQGLTIDPTSKLVALSPITQIGSFVGGVVLSNDGTIDLASGQAPIGRKLKIAGNYSGSGTLRLRTSLMDDNAPTDQLIIDGNTSATASGPTRVYITNVGGTGAKTKGNGIKIIDVAGASDTNAFVLANTNYKSKDGKQLLKVGKYGYALVLNAADGSQDGDWYLRSTIVKERKTAKTGNPLAAYQYGLRLSQSMRSEQQRTANRGLMLFANAETNLACADDKDRERTIICRDSSPLWLEVGADTGRWQADGTSRYDTSNNHIRGGLDVAILSDNRGSLVGSIGAIYAHSNLEQTNTTNTDSVTIDSVGLNTALAWYGTDGLYIDAQLQHDWTNADIATSVALTDKDSIDGTTTSIALEIGKRLAVTESVFLTPQMQVMYTDSQAVNLKDSTGQEIKSSSDNNTRVRAGIAIDKVFQSYEENQKSKGSIHGHANLIYDFERDLSATVAGASAQTRIDPLQFELGVSGRVNPAENISLFAELSARASASNPTDSFALGATGGFSLRW
jgi:outer membrane autotransporter protein